MKKMFSFTAAMLVAAMALMSPASAQRTSDIVDNACEGTDCR